MKCASCHDHFENDEWPQERFLAFAGLFATHDLERIRCELKTGEIVAARFPFDMPGASQAVPADVPGRLHLAAQLIIDPANPRFARTIVNRLWKRYLGLGLFEPADDFRLDTPASHPELLDWLAYDFVEHGCDLKHTIRLILTSRTYQLRYDPQLADQFDAARKDAPRYFRSPGLRRLTAEQFLDSVRVATAGELEPAERTFLDVAFDGTGPSAGAPGLAQRDQHLAARRRGRGAIAGTAQWPRIARDDLFEHVVRRRGRAAGSAPAGRSAVPRHAQSAGDRGREERWAGLPGRLRGRPRTA